MKKFFSSKIDRLSDFYSDLHNMSCHADISVHHLFDIHLQGHSQSFKRRGGKGGLGEFKMVALHRPCTKCNSRGAALLTEGAQVQLPLWLCPCTTIIIYI